MADFPAFCLRGLRTKDYVVQDALGITLGISGMAFEPDVNTEALRADGKIETSINWEDDDYALDFTLRDSRNATFGVARLQKSKIDEANFLPNPPTIPPGQRVFYERAPEDKNDYHGNIIYFAKIHKTFRRLISGVLASNSELIPPKYRGQ